MTAYNNEIETTMVEIITLTKLTYYTPKMYRVLNKEHNKWEHVCCESVAWKVTVNPTLEEGKDSNYTIQKELTE